MYIDEPEYLLVDFDLEEYYINRGIDYLSRKLGLDEEVIREVTEKKAELKKCVVELGELTDPFNSFLLFLKRRDYKSARILLVEKCKEILEDVLGKFDD